MGPRLGCMDGTRAHVPFSRPFFWRETEIIGIIGERETEGAAIAACKRGKEQTEEKDAVVREGGNEAEDYAGHHLRRRSRGRSCLAPARTSHEDLQ